MSTLLERERELEEIGAAVSRACAGCGNLVVVEAQAGLGKTRLLRAARESAAAAGMLVVSARATELERDFPFALVRQLFDLPLAAMTATERDALLDGTAGAARGPLGLARRDPDDEQSTDTFAVLNGFYWLIAGLAERGPLVVAVDDAHWSDVMSLDVLAFLLPRLEELPVLLVMTCRPDQPDAPASVARIAADASGTRLSPAALSDAATTSLLTTELGTPPAAAFAIACHEVSGGNPFFLGELARTLALREIAPDTNEIPAVRELVPERVTHTIQMRVERLSGHARAVARAVAVLGEDSDPRLVAAFCGVDAGAAQDGADELRAAAIFENAGPLRFVHPLVRSALYTNLPLGERASAHGHAADVLRADDASPERVAMHLLATDPCGNDATVETLLFAGRRALTNGAPRATVTYLMRASDEPPAPDMRAAVLSPMITACIRAGDPASFMRIEPAILTELERDPRLCAHWASKLGFWMSLMGRRDEALALLEQGIDIAMRDGEIARAFQLDAMLCTICHLSPTAIEARFARHIDRLEPGSPSEQLSLAFIALRSVFTATATDATALAQQTLERGDIFTAEQTGLVAANLVFVLVLADELDAARRIAEKAHAVAVERGATLELVGASMLSGCVLQASGDLAAAEADLRNGLDLASQANLPFAQPLLTALLIVVLTKRGELETATAELDATGLTGYIPRTLWLSPNLFARGLLRLAQGRNEDAAADLLKLDEWRRRWDLAGSPGMPCGLYAARALAALGDRARARELAEEELSHARRWGAPSAISNALQTLGTTIGGPEGLALLQAAAAVVDGSPARLVQAHALGELGAALRRSNRRVDAREPLRAALDLARRCGATALAKRMRDELQATGETVRRYTPIGVESLTPSERRVAELAASGLTNRQIAQTLFVTRKTIETHLAATYNKLGIHSRQELADALRPTVARTRT